MVFAPVCFFPGPLGGRGRYQAGFVNWQFAWLSPGFYWLGPLLYWRQFNRRFPFAYRPPETWQPVAFCHHAASSQPRSLALGPTALAMVFRGFRFLRLGLTRLMSFWSLVLKAIESICGKKLDSIASGVPSLQNDEDFWQTRKS